MYFANLNFLKRDSVQPDSCNLLTLDQVTLSNLVERKSEILLSGIMYFANLNFLKRSCLT